MVAQFPVKEEVVGSNPTVGAKSVPIDKRLSRHPFKVKSRVQIPLGSPYLSVV